MVIAHQAQKFCALVWKRISWFRHVGLLLLLLLLPLLQATSGSKQRVELAPTDSLLGEASRIAVAEACVQALQMVVTDNKAFALASVEGDGPGQDAGKWQQLFTACYPSAAKTAKSSVAV
jgi:hypothetical protein